MLAGEKSTSLSIVLHAHVPYVLPYTQWPGGAEWLYRAAAESFVPLLRTLHRVVAEGTSPRLTVALSPLLCEMLSDLEFAPGFHKYLHERIAGANANKREFAAQGFEHLSHSAMTWEGWYTGLDRDFEEQLNHDIVGALRAMQDEGHLEIIAAPATQAVLGHLSTVESIAAQVRIGIESYKKYFGRQPQGICLPKPTSTLYNAELVENLLALHGLKYFVPALASLENEGATAFLAEKWDLSGIAKEGSVPSFTHSSALPLRDDLARRVWSRRDGISSDGTFLDSRRQYFPGGLPYWRQTAPDANPAQTEPYDPALVGAACESHAEAWLQQLVQSSGGASTGIALDMLAVGYWWHEGPNWLRRVLRKASSHGVDLLTAGEAMQRGNFSASETTVVPNLAPLSQPENLAWVCEEVGKCEAEMAELARAHREVNNPKVREILDQCARELLLMQDSSWRVLLAGSEYRTLASQRLASHIEVFECLSAIADTVASGEFMSEGARSFLDTMQQRDRPFPDIAFTHWTETV